MSYLISKEEEKVNTSPLSSQSQKKKNPNVTKQGIVKNALDESKKERRQNNSDPLLQSQILELLKKNIHEESKGTKKGNNRKHPRRRKKLQTLVTSSRNNKPFATTQTDDETPLSSSSSSDNHIVRLIEKLQRSNSNSNLRDSLLTSLSLYQKFGDTDKIRNGNSCPLICPQRRDSSPLTYSYVQQRQNNCSDLFTSVSPHLESPRNTQRDTLLLSDTTHVIASEHASVLLSRDHEGPAASLVTEIHVTPRVSTEGLREEGRTMQETPDVNRPPSDTLSCPQFVSINDGSSSLAESGEGCTSLEVRNKTPLAYLEQQRLSQVSENSCRPIQSLQVSQQHDSLLSKSGKTVTSKVASREAYTSLAVSANQSQSAAITALPNYSAGASIVPPYSPLALSAQDHSSFSASPQAPTNLSVSASNHSCHNRSGYKELYADSIQNQSLAQSLNEEFPGFTHSVGVLPQTRGEYTLDISAQSEQTLSESHETAVPTTQDTYLATPNDGLIPRETAIINEASLSCLGDSAVSHSSNESSLFQSNNGMNSPLFRSSADLGEIPHPPTTFLNALLHHVPNSTLSHSRGPLSCGETSECFSPPLGHQILKEQNDVLMNQFLSHLLNHSALSSHLDILIDKVIEKRTHTHSASQTVEVKEEGVNTNGDRAGLGVESTPSSKITINTREQSVGCDESDLTKKEKKEEELCCLQYHREHKNVERASVIEINSIDSVVITPAQNYVIDKIDNCQTINFSPQKNSPLNVEKHICSFVKQNPRLESGNVIFLKNHKIEIKKNPSPSLSLSTISNQNNNCCL